MTNPIPEIPARKPGDPIELTLPSGSFARIRPSRFFDSLIATVASKDPKVIEALTKEFGEVPAQSDLWIVALMARLVTIDDERLTLFAVLNLDSRDSSAILTAMAPMLNGPVR